MPGRELAGRGEQRDGRPEGFFVNLRCRRSSPAARRPAGIESPPTVAPAASKEISAERVRGLRENPRETWELSLVSLIPSRKMRTREVGGGVDLAGRRGYAGFLSVRAALSVGCRRSGHLTGEPGLVVELGRGRGNEREGEANGPRSHRLPLVVVSDKTCDIPAGSRVRRGRGHGPRHGPSELGFLC